MKGGLGGEELLHAEAIGAQVVLQFGGASSVLCKRPGFFFSMVSLID